VLGLSAIGERVRPVASFCSSSDRGGIPQTDLSALHSLLRTPSAPGEHVVSIYHAPAQHFEPTPGALAADRTHHVRDRPHPGALGRHL
jgi:hypothetical protein